MLISLTIVSFILLLVFISKCNFSKYKEAGGSNSFLRVIETRVRYVLVQTEKKRGKHLEKSVREYISAEIKLITKFVIAFLFIALLISVLPDKKEDYVRRNSYGEGDKRVKIRISDGEKEIVQSLMVGAKEYTAAEFAVEVAECKDYLKDTICGDNPDVNSITNNLILPSKNREGTLDITWKSDDRTVISTEGKVYRSSIKEETEVELTAYITDGNYEDNLIFCLRVLPLTDSLMDAYEKLSELEASKRSEEDFYIPEGNDGISIEIVTETGIRTICKVLVLGIICTFSIVGLRFSRLKEKAKERSKALSYEYFTFVNKLSLYIGAGLSVRAALKRYVSNNNTSELSSELLICLNEIEQGEREEDCYVRLGKSLGLMEYIRTMSLISQSICHGTRSLRLLLYEEEENAARLRRDKIRKRGEEASGKLLVPMLLLLIVVIGIVMFPAIQGVNV